MYNKISDLSKNLGGVILRTKNDGRVNDYITCRRFDLKPLPTRTDFAQIALKAVRFM